LALKRTCLPEKGDFYDFSFKLIFKLQKSGQVKNSKFFVYSSARDILDMPLPLKSEKIEYTGAYDVTIRCHLHHVFLYGNQIKKHYKILSTGINLYQ
jgi:hypothetical protein